MFAALALILSACANQQQQATAVTSLSINAAYNLKVAGSIINGPGVRDRRAWTVDSRIKSKVHRISGLHS